MPDDPTARELSSAPNDARPANTLVGSKSEDELKSSEESIGSKSSKGEPNWKPAKRKSIFLQWLPLWVRKLLRLGIQTAIIGVLLTLGVATFYFIASLSYDIGEIQKMPERSVIFDIDGKELATLHGENRRLISRMELPDFFVSALEAREEWVGQRGRAAMAHGLV